MSVLQQTPSFHSSVASSHDTSDDVETKKVKHHAKEMLKSRIFLGRYTERRLINKNIGYRDIVLVSAAEVDLKRDLLEAQYKLSASCPKTQWIGITETDVIGCAPAGSVCLCTEIDNQPFGPFWFQIKSLKFRDHEVIVMLKCLRHISEAFLELEPILTGTKKCRDNSDIKAVATESLNETYTEIVDTLKSALSIRNLKEFFTFLFAFIIAVFTGSVAFVNFLGNFVLALVREMSLLIKNSTPMFLGLLDFFSKIVGGFYILLAMFFKPSAPVRSSSRTVAQYERMPRQSMYYDDKQFD